MKNFNWEIQFVLYCKGHFKNVSANKLDDLRRLFAKRCALDVSDVSAKAVANYLLADIVQPFILPHLNSFALCEVFEDISPDFVWRVGYPNTMPYDYYSAAVYKFASLIKLTKAKRFPSELLTARAESELLMDCARSFDFA